MGTLACSLFYPLLFNAKTGRAGVPILQGRVVERIECRPSSLTLRVGVRGHYVAESSPTMWSLPEQKRQATLMPMYFLANRRSCSQWAHLE